MKKTLLLATALVAGALAVRGIRSAGAADLPDAAELLPDVPIDHLTPPQRAALAPVAAEEVCSCGCPHTLAQCLRTHKECKHAPRMAQVASRMAGGGMPAGEIRKQLSDYYGSFEKGRRARLDLAAFGPPLGDPKAPVALVEFSDFICPYCQMVKPVLEEFVKKNASRLRLYHKPYPLANHPRAMEAALAAEWARDAGLFWPMYDALFANPHEMSDEDLANRAREVGGDPTALRAALTSQALRARIAGSMAEGRSAGMKGTPTLFLNGRRLALPDLGLDFTLEDEEEWTRHGGWAKD